MGDASATTRPPEARANRRLVVAAWPDGLPGPEHFALETGEIPRPGDAQVLVRNEWLSIDPYYRHALGPRFVGTPFRRPGDTMMGVTQGLVVESRDPRVREGTRVTTRDGGMQDYAVVDGRDVRPLSDEVFGDGRLPWSTALGVAGIPGLTAWAALTEHARARPGETFVVSSAGGCVGGTAGQIARTMGLRTVGIAGSDEKVAWALEAASFDACVSYREPDFAARLAAACPRGIDIDLEHVGGAVLDAVLASMAHDGRIVISGLIDQYGKAVAPPGPNWSVIVAKRLTVSGLSVFRYLDRMAEYERFVAPRVQDGSLAYREDVSIGLASAPAALARVLTGANFGKTLVRIAD